MALKHNLKMALRSMGYDPEILEGLVDEAGNGTEAVSKFKEKYEN